jgi:hypothetical protein
VKRFWRFLVGMIVVIFLTTAFSAAPKATEIVASSGGLIEVCNRGTAYVPPGTEYVTCQGKVMRVVGKVPLRGGQGAQESQVIGDCWCPKCCGNTCAILVSGGGGNLYILYLACGD